MKDRSLRLHWLNILVDDLEFDPSELSTRWNL